MWSLFYSSWVESGLVIADTLRTVIWGSQIIAVCDENEPIFGCEVSHIMYTALYHAIENAANKNTGKTLYIWRGACVRLVVLAAVFFMVWY